MHIPSSRFAENAKPTPAKLSVNRYVSGQRLYIGIEAIDPEMGAMVPWCDVTVNLPYAPISDTDCCGYVDLPNAPWLAKTIEENGLGEPTGRIATSGFCSYPEYRFNMKRVAEESL